MTYQKIFLVGNLGSEPRLRLTPNGKACTNFSLATNRRWPGADGQTQEETTWFQISTWGSLAEICNQYLSKGRQVFIEGRLSVDQNSGGPRVWTDQNGTPRASFEVTAFEVKFLGQKQASATQTPAEASTADEEIPF